MRYLRTASTVTLHDQRQRSPDESKMSSPTAADVISYIGIPLAVLGVLPIIYTCVGSIITLRTIRHALKKNGLTAITRGSLMSGIIEVELPRCSITPLDRDDPGYWLLNPFPSSLRGGSWTCFRWNQILTGHALYRLQYSDDLRMPQAEIDFEELLAFLLDRGAVPDVKGIHMLRLAGLWTPTGTNLLLSPDGSRSVLKISVPDDSDGILSLALSWDQAWDRRETDSLQPSWIRVRDCQLPAVESEIALQKNESVEKLNQDSEPDQSKDFPITKTESLSSTIPQPPTIQFHLSVRAGHPTVDFAVWDSSLSSTVHPSINHLHEPLPCLYFSACAIALAHLYDRAPWTVHIPAPVLALSAREAVPAGVLVLINLMSEKDAPACFTQYDSMEDQNAMSQKMRLRQQRIMAESKLPPAQAAAAKAARENEERNAYHDEFLAKNQRNRMRAENRDLEGLNSPRVDNSVAAQAAFTYLQRKEGFEACEDLKQGVEKILYGMIVNPETCTEVCGLMERWRLWTERGGMNKEDLKVIRQHIVRFCWACCLMGAVGMAAGKEESQVGLDMQECIRVWNKVRLG